MGRVVGVDYGTARIGLAISDESRLIARTLPHLTSEKKLELTAIKLVQALTSFSIEALVIGLPFRMNGKKGTLGDEVEYFASLLKTKVPYPIILWDERMTTLQAERILREAELSRKKRSKVIDSLSAVILLQSYLDSLSRNL